MTTLDKYYIVSRTGKELVCECLDHHYRKSNCKHIHVVLDVLKQNRCYVNNEFKIMERAKLSLCKYCSSGNIVKKGFRTNKYDKLQKYKCLECTRFFTTNFGFENTRVDNSTIIGAMQMYFSGMSVRDIANHYEMMGIKISYVAVYKWMVKYSKMTETYLKDIIPRTSGSTMVRADEVWLKVNGKKNYLSASIDNNTRFFLAYDMADTKHQYKVDDLLIRTNEAIDKSQAHFTTYGLAAYAKSS